MDFNFDIAEIVETEPRQQKKDIVIKLGSVRSVKGQTHCSTMYVEIEYHSSEIAKLTVFIKGTKKDQILPVRIHYSFSSGIFHIKILLLIFLSLNVERMFDSSKKE